MEIIGTFALVEESLYAVQWANEEGFLHTWNKCFELWNDPMYLFEFFTEHEEDLKILFGEVLLLKKQY